MTSSFEPLDAVRLVNSNQDSFPCKHCFKPFNNASQLLRHLTHNKLCQSEYGEDFVGVMRRESRCNSKRKWWEANKDKLKTEGKRKSYYTPNKVKISESGRAFNTVFRQVFQRYLEQARKDVKMHAEKRWLFVTNEDTDKALDETFIEYTWELDMEREMAKAKEFDGPEEEILQHVFSRLEAKFKFHLTFDTGAKVSHWRKYREYIIEKELFPHSQNKAFRLFYNEKDFKDMFEESKSDILDEVFFKLVTTENYFNDEEDLEKSMEKAYTSLLREEVIRKSKESGLETKLNTLMQAIMKEKLYYSELEYLCPK